MPDLDSLTLASLAGQFFGLVALVICLVAFASKNDDRLLVLLISANVAFALQFALFGSWTAAALTVLVIARIVLARRYVGSQWVMWVVLVANLVAAALTWRDWVDVLPLTAATLGTIAMFLLRGIPMRIMLGLAALAWMLNNLAIGSIGGTLAEGMIFVTNVVTIIRMARARKRYPGAAIDAAGPAGTTDQAPR
ncbi:YgjV family protein [Marinobacter bryozoorum]|uniref:YgjV family protein n=1 Tax=Marinobacter bryozoorum TaxID=256324 RepID=UPI0020035CF6|nr:YgjV family protein [Marinobacter bryozoorum]MCK7545585.1 YgjV family protein [Marinobacter bryozoorum]